MPLFLRRRTYSLFLIPIIMPLQQKLETPLLLKAIEHENIRIRNELIERGVDVNKGENVLSKDRTSWVITPLSRSLKEAELVKLF